MTKNKYIDVEIKDKILIKVAEIKWSRPDKPTINWLVYDEKPLNATEDEINMIIEKLLKDKEYFTICLECKDALPIGHTNPIGNNEKERICHACMSNHHGVVF